MLPGKDGFTVATELRKGNNYIPLLMLTARNQPEDVLKGFASGADDYLPKPFDLAILLARIRSLLRRREWAGTLLSDPPTDTRIAEARTTTSRASSMSIASGTRKSTSAPWSCTASRKTFRLTLMEAGAATLPHRQRGEERLAQANGSRSGDCTKTPTRAPSTTSSCACASTSNLIPSKPRYLLTVRGVGYRFLPDPQTLQKV